MEEKKKEQHDISDVEYKSGFNVDCHNILNEPTTLHFIGYEPLNIDKMGDTEEDKERGVRSPNLFNLQRITNKTEILIILRYFEYACIARVSFNYLKEIMKGGMNLIKSFDMIKHHLRIILNREVSGIENVVEMHVEYFGKIKY